MIGFGCSYIEAGRPVGLPVLFLGFGFWLWGASGRLWACLERVLAVGVPVFAPLAPMISCAARAELDLIGAEGVVASTWRP